jgi:cystathionine beta-lyase
MKYDFDRIIDRQGTNSLNTDGFREYIFKDLDNVEFPYADDEFIRMWVADMEFATPDVIVDSIKDRLDHGIFGYTRLYDSKYHQAFGDWTKRRYDWEFMKEHLYTSQGVIPALNDLVGYICKSDEKVLMVTPSYAYFKYAAEYNHVGLVISELINKDGYYEMDFEDMRKKAEDEKVTLAIFCNPHNPTGRVWTENELKTFGEICLDNGVRIISDEIHCDLLRAGQVHTPLAKVFPDTDKIITCMAPSKTFNMAGFMFANIIIPDAWVREKWEARQYPFNNPLSIAGAQAAYESGEPWLRELNEYLDSNFRYLDEFIKTELPLASFVIPESTYLAWLDIGAYLPDEQNLPLYFAKNGGVLLEGGNMFVSNSDGFIRLNVACPRSVLAEGLRRCKKAILL